MKWVWVALYRKMRFVIVLGGQKGKGTAGQFLLTELDSGYELVAQVSGLRRGKPQ